MSASYTNARPETAREALLPQDVILSASQPILYTRRITTDTGNPNQRQP